MYSREEIFTVCFFGHRYIDSFKIIETQIEELIREIITVHKYVEFLVGRNGDFDQIVSSVIKSVKKEFCGIECTHILVLPYHSAVLRKNEKCFFDYYDEIEICPDSCTAHFKNAIQIRNKKMIDRADLCVFYVEHQSGGAFQSMQYAVKKNKQIVNLTDMSINAF